MPIDYKRYPKNWKELRQQVLDRAKNKCEFCNAVNYRWGFRDDSGEFNELDKETCLYFGHKPIRIILTIAHLDHDEENHNVKIDRLAALCQRCHLVYDINEKKKRRKDKKAIGRFL